ncbi:MAG TPA: sigma-70 family RNA polymerase sigma factor [Bryobacteraceae bacterium]|nr:sigma-70 family RNA polymerase sigma factor [Bryobacteraceae bacterium]
MADIVVGLHLDAQSPKPGPERAGCAEDESLVAALQRGSEEAYEMLITRFQQPVFNLVCRLTGDPPEASDIVQEVFLKIFRSIGSFRSKSSLRTWIYRITVNEAYNHRRWFCRHQRQEVGMAEEEHGRTYEDTLADHGRSPFDLAADTETRMLLEGALEGLNPKFRAAVVLRDIEDLSYEEIAAVLDISLGTVKSRILRGREALRKILAGRLEPEPGFRLSPQPVE